MTRDQLIAKLQELPENREIKFSRQLWDYNTIRESSDPYKVLIDEDDSSYWMEEDPPDKDQGDQEWFEGLEKAYIIDLE